MKVSSVLKTLALMSILIQHTSLMVGKTPSKTSPQEADSSTEGNGSEGGDKKTKKNRGALAVAAGAGFATAIAVTNRNDGVEVASE